MLKAVNQFNIPMLESHVFPEDSRTMVYMGMKIYLGKIDGTWHYFIIGKLLNDYGLKTSSPYPFRTQGEAIKYAVKTITDYFRYEESIIYRCVCPSGLQPYYNPIGNLNREITKRRAIAWYMRNQHVFGCDRRITLKLGTQIIGKLKINFGFFSVVLENNNLFLDCGEDFPDEIYYFYCQAYGVVVFDWYELLNDSPF